MSKLPAVQAAVKQDRVVVACAYDTHLPAELAGQLPSRGARSFVARIEGGQVVSVTPGTPEDVLPSQLAAP